MASPISWVVDGIDSFEANMKWAVFRHVIRAAGLLLVTSCTRQPVPPGGGLKRAGERRDIDVALLHARTR